MSKKLSSTQQLALSTTIVGVVSIASYFYYRHKSQKPRQTLKDLQGNFYATGSDVCRLYASKITNLIVVITGTSSGLGFQTAKLLGTHGAFIILGNRQPNHTTIVELVREIEQKGGNVLSLPLDLASLASVKIFAQQVQAALQGKKLNVLIHNAGVSFLNGSTQDGYQRVWQVNVLAPSLLTELLLPNICPDNGRVISVSSEMHRACFFNIVDQCPPNKEKGKSTLDYALSKACQILQALELNHRQHESSSKKIRGFAIEPGLVRTNIGRHTSQFLLEMEYFLLGPLYLRSIDQGTSSTIFCALAPVEDLGEGGYYFANCMPKTPKGNCTDLEEARRLQRLCYNIWKSYL